jgi:hypothetical protein
MKDRAGEEKTMMRNAIALVMALGLVIVFSGAVLADGFGTCNYSSHVNQAAADKAGISKTVTTKVVPKADADKRILTHTAKAGKPLSTTKK